MYELQTRPSFIFSNVRTGSTLLRNLIGTHPEIWAPDELNLGPLAEAIVGVTEAVRQVPAKEAMSPGDLPPEELCDDARRMIDDLMTRGCQTKDATIWCDKSPLNFYHASYLRHVFPEAHLIVLARHPLDNVYSMIQAYKHGVTVPLLARQVRANPSDFVTAFTRAWLECYESLSTLADAHDDVLVVRYEDLVVNPEDVVSRLESLYDLEFPDDILTRMFETEHITRSRRGDTHIKWDSKIKKDRLGRGRNLGWEKFDANLVERTNRVLERLGYPLLDPSEPQYDVGVPIPELSDEVDEPGEDEVALADVIEALQKRLDERVDPSSEQEAKVKVVAEPDGVLLVDVGARTVELSDGDADVTLKLATSDLRDLLDGELNPMIAFKEGKLSLEGDYELLTTVGSILLM